MIVRIATVSIAASCAAWSLFHFAYRPHQCNAAISNLTTRTDAAVRTANDYERTVRARRNLQDLARLRTTCSTSVRVPMLIGANEEMVERLEDAKQSYRLALSIEPRPEIYVAIATVALQLGQVDEAVENYAAAARFAPVIVEDISSIQLKERVLDRLSKR